MRGRATICVQRAYAVAGKKISGISRNDLGRSCNALIQQARTSSRSVRSAICVQGTHQFMSSLAIVEPAIPRGWDEGADADDDGG
mmetsp:Transcript_46909/g.142102  ORF Transcript_46909/g.142102 Transcript_46909/m.142102 type:complete len:85 (+) Transcript_46909:285-539(+)